MEIGFDVIGDLHLQPDETFKWENKATSLYCIIAGNISSDVRTVIQTLSHLSKLYHGVFYIPGYLEYDGLDDIHYRTDELASVCSHFGNVTLLYRNVAIIDGIAITGVNGWAQVTEEYTITNMQKIYEREDDFMYTCNTITKLQKHLDVKKIVVVSNTVPKTELYFGQKPKLISEIHDMSECLLRDTEKKVSHWIYGTYENVVDITINNINYINNSYFKRKNYWAKRISVTV